MVNNKSNKTIGQSGYQSAAQTKRPLNESQRDRDLSQESIQMGSHSSSQSVSDQTSQVLKEWEESIAKEILGSTQATGDLMFYIEFDNKRELVPSEVAKRLCPQLVIHYFEKYIVWLNDSNESDTECQSTH